MKMKFLLSALAAVCCAVPLCGTDDGSAKFEDVYDIYAPSGKVEKFYIIVDGDVSTGRVSFLKGKNPLVVPDAKGKLMEKDPNPDVATVFANVDYTGGEESRSFCLSKWVDVKPDKWIKYVVSFRPRRSGKIRISVRQGESGWVAKHDFPKLSFGQFAKFESTTLKVKDPEMLKPATWGVKLKHDRWPKNVKAELMVDENGPVKKYLRSYCGISQTFDVKGDNNGKYEYTFSVYLRSDDWFTSKR